MIDRAFNYRGGTHGSLEWTLNDGVIKYVVKWEIKNTLDTWVKEKLKDTLNLTEWINTKDDGKVVHKLQERKPKAM